MNYTLILVSLALVVEFLTQIGKDIINAIQNKDWWDLGVKALAVVIGIAVAIIANKELLPLLGHDPLESGGLIALAGIGISAGATKVFDLFNRIRGKGSQVEVE